MNSQNNTNFNNKFKQIINIHSFDDDDDSIQIVISQPKDNHTRSNQVQSKLNANHKFIPRSKEQLLKQFTSKIGSRQKQRQKNPVINIDDRLAPTQHTRSRGAVIGVNEFVTNPIQLEDQQKQFKLGRYEFANTKKTQLNSNKNFQFNNRQKTNESNNKNNQFSFNNRQKTLQINSNHNKGESNLVKRFQNEVKKKPRQIFQQTKLPVISLEMKNYGFDQIKMPKPGQNIHPPRKRPQPEMPLHKGIQFNLIRNNRFNQSQKQKQQRKKQKQQLRKQLKIKQQRNKQDRLIQIQNTFSNLLGLGSNQITNQNNVSCIQISKQSQQNELKNLDMLEQIQKQQQNLIQEDNYYNGQNLYQPVRRVKYSLNQIVRPYDSSHAFPFIKAILAFKFTQNLQLNTNKRIPQIFEDADVYKKTFHYLVINQCIADLHQRMKKLQKQTAQKLDIQINEISKNGNGLLQIKIKEIVVPSSNELIQTQETFLLKNYSMSKNRLGIITSHKYFDFNNYGVHSDGKTHQLSYTFLCMLKTPQSKQQLKQDVKVQASINQRDLQYILKITKNKQAYFYDLQKLSTNMREYMSISNIQYSLLASHIYNPQFIQTQQHNMVTSHTRNLIDDVFGVLQKNFNQIQFQSIRQMTLRESGIVLLQGPPGTGKTSTLLGLLSAQYAYLKRIGDPRKIMICAPSNAAIDHITKRIQVQGLIDGNGYKIMPKVLRMGIVQTDDPDITRCSLDHICQSKVVEQKNKSLKQSNLTTVQIRQKLMNLQKQIKNINLNIYKCSKQTNSGQKVKNLQLQLKQKNDEYLRLQNLLYSFRRQKIISKKYYQEVQKKLMKQAEIVITTLSSSGGQKSQFIRGQIACLIVDEAAQATEPSLLIAFQTGVQKVMLIGDPYQLPATTLSTDSNITLFNRSLFQRFIDSGIQPYFLKIQYRMAQMIRQFPSLKFYQNRLVDGQNIFKRKVPSVLQNFSKDRNVIFIDVKNGQQKVSDSSFCNYRQAIIIKRIIGMYKLTQKDISIGIITPYQAQRKVLLKEIQNEHINFNHKNKNQQAKNGNKQNGIKQSQKETQTKKKSNLMINTIDSFQGQQKDLIFISTVRCNDRKQIGFLIDQRRINVAITRAKYAMIIVGNGDTLGSNQVWDDYLKSIQSKNLYFQINSAQQQDLLVKNINKNQYFNTQTVRRRYYPQCELTSDPRKQKIQHITNEDFKKSIARRLQGYSLKTGLGPLTKNKQNFNSEKYVDIHNNSTQKSFKQQMMIKQSPISQQGNLNQSQQQNKRQNFGNQSQNSIKRTNQPLFDDIEIDSLNMIKKKLKKQEQVVTFQATIQRIKQVQKQKANDDFYKFLFQ